MILRRIFFALICCILSAVSYGQVRPDQFTEITQADSSNFEVYSQKAGTPRRINGHTLREYFLLDIIDGYQSVPTDTGNADIGRLIKTATGYKYIIDGDGESEMIYDSSQTQSLTFRNDSILISGANGVDLSGLSGGGTDDQTVSFDGTNLTIEDGNSVDLSSLASGTALGDTMTMLNWGNSYNHNNSDSTNTAGVYTLNTNIFAYDYRRDSVGVMVEDTSLYSAPLNNPPQVIGTADGSGIDRWARNTVWANHFAKQWAAEDRARRVFMLTAGKGGVTLKDSLSIGPYRDTLNAYIDEAIAANSVYGHYDFVLLGIGPQEDSYTLEADVLRLWNWLKDTKGVVDETSVLILKDAPVDLNSNKDYNSSIDYLGEKYEFIHVVRGTSGFTTFDGTHPSAAQLKTIGEIAYRSVFGQQNSSSDTDSRDNFVVGPSNLKGIGGAETSGNRIILPNPFDVSAIDSLVNVDIWSPDSISITGWARNVYINGPNLGNLSINGRQNIIINGWNNYVNGTGRDSMIIIGWENGVSSTKAFNAIGSWNSTSHNFVDFLFSNSQTSAGHGEKYLFAGTGFATDLIVGDSAWVFGIDNTPAEGEVMTFSSGEWVGAAAGAGTDDQTLAEVLTEGATANTAIDMDGNNLNNVGNLTIDATTNDFVIDGNGTSLEVTVAASEVFSVDQTGVAQFNNAFSMPNADGTSGQVLKTDGAGTLTWQDDNNSGGGGGTVVQGYYFVARDTSTAAISTGSWQDITFDTEVKEDNSYTHASNSATITLDTTALYEIRVSFEVVSPARSDLYYNLSVDTGGGYSIEKQGKVPVIFDTSPTFTTVSDTWEITYDATAGDDIKVQVYTDDPGFSFGATEIKISRLE